MRQLDGTLNLIETVGVQPEYFYNPRKSSFDLEMIETTFERPGLICLSDSLEDDLDV